MIWKLSQRLLVTLCEVARWPDAVAHPCGETRQSVIRFPLGPAARPRGRGAISYSGTDTNWATDAASLADWPGQVSAFAAAAPCG